MHLDGLLAATAPGSHVFSAPIDLCWQSPLGLAARRFRAERQPQLDKQRMGEPRSRHRHQCACSTCCQARCSDHARCCNLPAALMQSEERRTRHCLRREHNREAGAQWNMDTSRQERLIMALVISALGWMRPIMPGIVMQGRSKRGGSFGNGLLHSRPLPTRPTNQNPQPFPTFTAQIASNTMTCGQPLN
jgi:hypothetical protein